MYCQFVILVSVAITAVFTENAVKNLEVNVVYVENFDDYFKTNPSLKYTKLETEVIISGPDALLRHTLANRVSGDRIIASGNNKYTYPIEHNAQIELNYPASGYGDIVTAIEIYVQQSTEVGDAYAIDGGVGQRKVTILVRAASTKYFNYQAYLFGY